jgi:hypothetical protein
VTTKNNITDCNIKQFNSGIGDNIDNHQITYGDKFYHQSNWWWGLLWGFILGIPSSYLASWLWAVVPLK